MRNWEEHLQNHPDNIEIDCEELLVTQNQQDNIEIECEELGGPLAESAG
jgi:phage-related protein